MKKNDSKSNDAKSSKPQPKPQPPTRPHGQVGHTAEMAVPEREGTVEIRKSEDRTY
jgi:hypothetical protein